ncbi:MAG TPA: AAA family ATPase [Candidatus Binataceae bacterium]|nr:AAA family ATPase [Candidatus Binataceae bacterium]
MIARLEIENFRSISGCDLKLAPLTVFYGPTSAGKSSALYALCVLRNFIVNPNQSADSFFNLGFQNLGGFEACVFNHEGERGIKIHVGFVGERGESGYGITLRKTSAQLRLDTPVKQLTEDVPVPYALNQTFAREVKLPEGVFTLNWNGFASSAVPAEPTAETQAYAVNLAQQLNRPVHEIMRIDIAPHRRGFFKPNYTAVPLSPLQTTEDEVATLIINDPNLPAKISIDVEEIFGRDFRTYVPPGTATMYFQTTEKKSRTPAYLVNDGFGVNQAVYMLAKIHRAGVKTILIEEPEVHLHPSAIRKFVGVLARVASEDDKQLLFTTHSEQFMVSLLTCVAEKKLDPSQLCVYHVDRLKRETQFEAQAVTAEGQLEGGLTSFLEVELQDLKKFLAASN